MEVVQEQDVFKYLVLREEGSKEEKTEVLKNLSIFSSRVSENIFTNEYFVLYKALVESKRYNTALTRDQLYQMIVNNINKVVQEPSIIAEEFAENPGDEEEVKEELADLCMLTFDDLREMNVDDLGEMKANLDLYLESWGQDQLSKVITEQHTIATKGKKIKGKFLHGIDDSDEFYTSQIARIKQLVRDEVDSERNVIRNDKMSAHEIKAKFKNESTTRNVTHTNVDSIDEHIQDMRIGDMVSIMGQPGAGKTRFSANILYNAIKRGNSILWYALEGSALQALSLLVARHIVEEFEDRIKLHDKAIFDVSYDSKFDELVDVAMNDLLNNENYGKIQIRNESLYDDEFFGELERTWDEGFHFSVVCVDYVSLIMNKKGEAPNQYLSRLVKKLKSESMNFKDHGFLTLLPHQLTREVIQGLIRGEDATITGSADTSEVIKSSDMSFSLYRTGDQIAQDRITFHFTKTRFASSVPEIEILADHGRCYFADVPE